MNISVLHSGAVPLQVDRGTTRPLVVSHVCDCIFQMKPIRMPIDFSSHILLYKDGFNEKYNFFAKLIKQKVRDAKNPAHT